MAQAPSLALDRPPRLRRLRPSHPNTNAHPATKPLTPISQLTQTMNDFSLKHVARAIAEAAGVPVLKGSGLVETAEAAVEAAEGIGYPVLLKATGGGGGRWGMRACDLAASPAPP